MTLNVPSFFAGIGTVVVLLTLGFGGGVLMSGVISDKPREPGKVEKWAVEQKASAEQKTPDAQKPAIITATPVPVAPAQAAPPPAPQPIVNAEPAPQPALPVASNPPAPQPAADAAPVTAPAPPAPAPVRQASQPLQQKPVALVDPAVPQPQAKPQTTKRADKRNDRRKQATERRRQPQIDNASARTADQRPRQQEIDDDDDDVRAPLPFFRGREREETRRPFFGFFGNDD